MPLIYTRTTAAAEEAKEAEEKPKEENAQTDVCKARTRKLLAVVKMSGYIVLA